MNDDFTTTVLGAATSRVLTLILLVLFAAGAVTSLAQTSGTDHPMTGASEMNTNHGTGATVIGGAGNKPYSEASGGDTPSSPELTPVGSNAQDYVISDNDVLELYVMDVAELSRAYRVSENGTVIIPMLKQPIHASGLTLQRFAGVVESELRSAGLVSNPHVLVSVKNSPMHAVAITGAVRRAQTYPVFARTTLLDVLSDAGGLTDNAGAVARITRGGIATGEKAGQTSAVQKGQIVTVDLKQLLETGDPRLNVPIFPGDTVTIPPGGIVYVVGAVNKPGGFVISIEQENMTVLQALALAENAKSTAARDKAMIVRRGTGPNNDKSPGAARDEIPVKLSQIMSGKAPDVCLQPNDILFIPDSGSKKAFSRGAEAAVQMATGLAIWSHP